MTTQVGARIPRRPRFAILHSKTGSRRNRKVDMLCQKAEISLVEESRDKQTVGINWVVQAWQCASAQWSQT